MNTSMLIFGLTIPLLQTLLIQPGKSEWFKIGRFLTLNYILIFLAVYALKLSSSVWALTAAGLILWPVCRIFQKAVPLNHERGFDFYFISLLFISAWNLYFAGQADMCSGLLMCLLIAGLFFIFQAAWARMKLEEMPKLTAGIPALLIFSGIFLLALFGFLRI